MACSKEISTVCDVDLTINNINNFRFSERGSLLLNKKTKWNWKNFFKKLCCCWKTQKEEKKSEKVSVQKVKEASLIRQELPSSPLESYQSSQQSALVGSEGSLGSAMKTLKVRDLLNDNEQLKKLIEKNDYHDVFIIGTDQFAIINNNNQINPSTYGMMNCVTLLIYSTTTLIKGIADDELGATLLAHFDPKHIAKNHVLTVLDAFMNHLKAQSFRTKVPAPSKTDHEVQSTIFKTLTNENTLIGLFGGPRIAGNNENQWKLQNLIEDYFKWKKETKPKIINGPHTYVKEFEIEEYCDTQDVVFDKSSLIAYVITNHRTECTFTSESLKNAKEKRSTHYERKTSHKKYEKSKDISKDTSSFIEMDNLLTGENLVNRFNEAVKGKDESDINFLINQGVCELFKEKLTIEAQEKCP